MELSGERGASSAEEFLRRGYRVVFLYRKGSYYPFTRHIRKSVSDCIDGNLLAAMIVSGD